MRKIVVQFSRTEKQATDQLKETSEKLIIVILNEVKYLTIVMKKDSRLYSECL